jgi:hypothetical protein
MTDGEDYDPDLHGPVVVIELGDTVEQLERDLGCSILQDPQPCSSCSSAQCPSP